VKEKTMIEVRNLLFQPLTFQLAGGGSLHLGPRERRAIKPEQVSPELEQAKRRSFVDLREAGKPAAAEAEAPAKTKSGTKRTRRSK
jgi:hypothetical protein